MLVFLGIAVGFLTMIKEKLVGEIYTQFDAGKKVSFELTEGRTLWLEETNHGLGSLPGTIRDPGRV